MASIEQILSIESAKANLRLPENDDSMNAEIEGYIAAAVAEVEAKAGLDLVTKDIIRTAAVPSSCNAKNFNPEFDCNSQPTLKAANWFDADGRDLGTASISNIAVVRRFADEHGRGKYGLVTPLSGWTEWPNPAGISVTLTVGVSEVPKSLSQAAILLVRDYFDSSNFESVTKAVERICLPFAASRAGILTF